MKLVTVIPTYNEAGALGALLEALFAQTIPGHEAHVLVVDDASPDGTADLAAAAAGRWPGRLAVLR
ncbi:MAG: glycosyltransferase, partial [Candidatus Binatia bacterium]